MSNQLNMVNLTRERALVLVGPQGCDKSTVALRIAEKRGGYCVIEEHQLDSPFALGTALKSKPETLIIEGAPLTKQAKGPAKRKAGVGRAS